MIQGLGILLVVFAVVGVLHWLSQKSLQLTPEQKNERVFSFGMFMGFLLYLVEPSVFLKKAYLSGFRAYNVSLGSLLSGSTIGVRSTLQRKFNESQSLGPLLSSPLLFLSCIYV